MTDKLEEFLNWWLDTREFKPPKDTPVDFGNDRYSGAILYRDGQFQVQLLTVKPISVIPEHIHPNIDSYEVYISGDIVFSLEGEKSKGMEPFESIRVKPSNWHGGTFGDTGGCFLSVQHWLNDVKPTSVGYDWHDKEGHESSVVTEWSKEL